MHPIFDACCAKKPTRYDLTKPFRQRGHLYAADGFIIVRLPSRGKDTPNMPDVAGLQWNAHASEPTPLPPMPLEVERKCSTCMGSGELTVLSKCKQCGCKVLVCNGCDGLGVIVDAVSVPVGDTAIGSDHLKLLHEHEAKLYLPLEPRNLLRFTVGDHIEGLVMPRVMP